MPAYRLADAKLDSLFAAATVHREMRRPSRRDQPVPARHTVAVTRLADLHGTDIMKRIVTIGRMDAKGLIVLAAHR